MARWPPGRLGPPRPLRRAAVVLAATAARHAGASAAAVEAPTIRLSNGEALPAVGFGVGNLAHELIEDAVVEAVDKHQVRLIDTAAASRNEHIVSAALRRADRGRDVTVLTKVWYTHLGFERTLFSVRESVKRLGGDGTQRPAVLLHWPRCRRDVSWMRCEEEEAELPEEVRRLGPAPHLDPDAWQGSWRALEELYKEGVVSSIGVSNFDPREMETLAGMAKVKPHILQGSMWHLLFDPALMDVLQRHEVVFQVYGVLSGTLAGGKQTSVAFQSLGALAQELGVASVPQLMLGWLVQQGVSVVPRSSSPEHRLANSPTSAGAVPALDAARREKVHGAVVALLRGTGDGAPTNSATVRAAFVNRATEPVEVLWVHPKTGEEVRAAGTIPAGGESEIDSHPGHVFVARSLSSGAVVQRFEITLGYGHTQRFHVTAAKGEL